MGYRERETVATPNYDYMDDVVREIKSLISRRPVEKTESRNLYDETLNTKLLKFVELFDKRKTTSLFIREACGMLPPNERKHVVTSLVRDLQHDTDSNSNKKPNGAKNSKARA